MRRLFIHATNVHQGGGKALLDALIRSGVSREERVLLLDSRMAQVMQYSNVGHIKPVNPSVLQRFLAEWWLAKHVCEKDTILCFGNLPPLFKLSGRVVVFVQNRYLLESVGLAGFSWKTRLRLSVERLWFRWRVVNVDQFIVQTPAMKAELEFVLGRKALCLDESACEKIGITIQTLPFVNVVEGYQRTQTVPQREGKKGFDFLYVASGEPHKNHRHLIEAWCLLAAEGRFPSLAITVDETNFAGLCEWIEKKKSQYNLQLDNLGVLSHDQIKRLYQQAGALVYPSTFESFGLPLIEARQAGLPVLASELDYVRDVLDPEQSFDPESATSIARAVKRFMGWEILPLPLLDAVEFIKHVLEKAE
jgi:glycosyltransferase involved in cell wall biosynthesis